MNVNFIEQMNKTKIKECSDEYKSDKDKKRESLAKKLMENEISTQFFIKKTNL
jgi:hypothetical protein